MKKVLIVLSSAMILAAGASSSVSAFEHDANMDSYVQKFKDGTFISDTNRDGKFLKSFSFSTYVFCCYTI